VLGLGWPQWLTIIGLVAGLILTFKIMARASVSYEKARRRRESQARAEHEELQRQLREELREDERR
jgi:type VI protein secretion system component VasK